jgi:hypothetical protein
MGAQTAGSLDCPASEHRRRRGSRGRRRRRRVGQARRASGVPLLRQPAVIAWKDRRQAARRLG